MTALVAAVAGALVVAGLLGLVAGLVPAPAPAAPARPGPARQPRPSRLVRVDRRTRILLVAGLVVGVGVALSTGWVVAVLVIPAALAGLPLLLGAGGEAAHTARLEAMQDWTRSLAGVLSVSVGLEQALIATLRSTPAPIRPQVSALTARLRARWSTEDAVRAFADDLDDATGDLIAGYLILGARRRGAGLAVVLQTLAESVAADVAARREIEADRAKPRSTARWVTIITVAFLAFLALTGDYVRPYGTPIGQVLLVTLLSAYVGALVWMRRMTTGSPPPRFIGAATGKVEI